MKSLLLPLAVVFLFFATSAFAQRFPNRWQRFQPPFGHQPAPPNSALPNYGTWPPAYPPQGGQQWGGLPAHAQPNHFQPNHFQPNLPQQTLPGSITRVLPDGRVAIITPFTEKQKREIRKQEAYRLHVREIRLRDLAQQGENNSLYPRLPGEFEKQDAILISVSDWQPHHFNVLLELIEKARGHAGILILYNDKNLYDGKPQLLELVRLLSRSGNNYPHLRFLKLNLDTVWLRDFGPRLAETEEGGAMAMDFFYETVRRRDDKLPEAWASLTRAKHNLVPWSLQGGNLLSNGRGLSITTSRLFEENRIRRPGKTTEQDEVYIKQQFMKFCNIKQLLVLKPLEQEATRHVDMFASFLAPDLVLVAKVDPRHDSLNARILDYNAQLLSRAKVDGRPLRVERIWIPPRRGQNWSSYTNIILTDRLVLLPTYQSDSPRYVQNAISTYKRLLPKHHVATIDMTSMEKLGGSLHCLSSSLPRFGKLPKGMLSFKEAAAKVGQLRTSAKK